MQTQNRFSLSLNAMAAFRFFAFTRYMTGGLPMF